MATDATFNNQLQALATATANFAQDKDTQIKNTIITALGGGSSSGKRIPTLTVTQTAPHTFVYTYDGDGTVKAINGTIYYEDHRIGVDDDTSGVVYALETENCAAAVAEFQS